MKKDFFDDDNIASDSIDFDPEDRKNERFNGDSDDDWFESKSKKQTDFAARNDQLKSEKKRTDRAKSPSPLVLIVAVAAICFVFGGVISLAALNVHLSNRPGQGQSLSSLFGNITITTIPTPTPDPADPKKPFQVEVQPVWNFISESPTPTPEPSVPGEKTQGSAESTEEALPELEVVDIYGNVPINEVTFPDEIFRNGVMEVIDLDSDGILSPDERRGLTDLFVGSNRGIRNLKGIEYFIYLKSLDCGWNELTELDLRHNPRLEIVSCCGNNITELDVSNNPRLRNLYCFENELTSLDVTNNPELRTLECYDNQLSELDVSKNPKLSMLLCYRNQLTELETGSNPALALLECECNRILRLDLGKNPALLSLKIDSDVILLGVSQTVSIDTYFDEEESLDEWWENHLSIPSSFSDVDVL